MVLKMKARDLYTHCGLLTKVFSDEAISYLKMPRSHQSSLFDVDFSEEKAFGQWCTDDECEDRQGIVISRDEHPDLSLNPNKDFRMLVR